MAIGNTFVPNKHDMKNVQNGNIIILDAVDQDALLGVVFGSYLLQFCMGCLSLLGYLAGLEFLLKMVMFLLNLYRRGGQQGQNIHINLSEREREIGDDWQSAFRSEREELLHQDDVLSITSNHLKVQQVNNQLCQALGEWVGW